ncbi:MAG: bifunctional 23S rRNA (guanine(2069)-N(7))-methyltransferase RlmK/23S rRNA (guanine(2445)-N(2))-methyltransferase RlmL [Myxococcota bacterium]|nr:bifunctional 23S rRNA (guanine(2069)-N(7))-methyltransferase RlmK/23S rRNA (guanine(2445)-N(2))-methyltransferase RlmL [Myxococcota bacterium]
MRWLSTAAYGAESVLEREVRALLAREAEVRVERGLVAFDGTLEEGYRIRVESFVASRLLALVAEFHTKDSAALRDAAREVRWEEHLDPDETFAVDVAGRMPDGEDARLFALRVKDAVADRLRARTGRRPDVDRRNPRVRLHVRVLDDCSLLCVDVGGGPLHRRGGRPAAAAPLRETLAAALLHLMEWPARAEGGRPLFDPMCGSGTLLVEAAAMVRRLVPGLRRDERLDGWKGHDQVLFRDVLERARERWRVHARVPVRVAGTDASSDAVRRARQLVAQAGLEDAVQIAQARFDDVEPPQGPPGVLFVNPPWGERLGEVGELGALYARLGDVLRRRFLGWDAFVLAGNPALARRIGLRVRRRWSLQDGPVAARLLHVPIDPEPPRGAAPRWRAPSERAAMLRDRLRRNLRRLGPWLRREGITSYRLYDHDIPEYHLSVDVYEGRHARVDFHGPTDGEGARRLEDAVAVVRDVMGLGETDVTVRVRRRRDAAREPYPRRPEAPRWLQVREAGLRFLVDVDGHLDTGLFLDERRLRAFVGRLARGARFLNLFAYTGAVTVYAAAGGALETTSVDRSASYLRWAARNLRLNGFEPGPRHRLVRSDVEPFLREAARRGVRWDLVHAGPPAYSDASRDGGEDFDLRRDLRRLLEAIGPCVAPSGRLVLSIVARGVAPFDAPGWNVSEITSQTRSRDFERARSAHRAFLLLPAAAGTTRGVDAHRRSTS